MLDQKSEDEIDLTGIPFMGNIKYSLDLGNFSKRACNS